MVMCETTKRLRTIEISHPSSPGLTMKSLSEEYEMGTLIRCGPKMHLRFSTPQILMVAPSVSGDGSRVKGSNIVRMFDMPR